MKLNLRPAEECKYDAVSLGEDVSGQQGISAHGKGAENIM